MIRKFPLAFLLLWCISPLLWAQGVDRTYVDSVFQEIERAGDFDQKNQLVRDLCLKIVRLNSPESQALFRYMDSIAPSDEIRMMFYKEWGPTASRLGDPQRSWEIRREGLRIARRYENRNYVFDYLNTLSSHFVNMSQADSATYYINEVQKLIDADPEELKQTQWVVYHRRSDIQNILGNYDAQGENLEKAWEELKDTDSRNKGFILYLNTDFFRQRKDYMKQAKYTELLSEYYHEKELNTPDFHFPVESMLIKSNSPEAIADLKRIHHISDSLNNLNAVSSTSLALGRALLNTGRADELIPILQKTIAKLDSANYPFSNSGERYLLQEAYAATGDFEKAYMGLLDQKKMEDSLRSGEMLARIADYEVKYETQEKERALEKKAASEKLLFWILGSAAVVLAILSFFFLKNRKKNRLLAKQKKLLEATIDEKNVLLKETHHRVKNSFQIVSSLLYLQSENMADKEAQLAIKEAQNRVRSMVLIHQKLYNKDQLVGINTQEYFNDLTRDIFESHTDSENKIDYSMNVESMVLDIETITPIGLILNELITNVLKHAFDTSSSAKNLQIDFDKKEDELVLSVQDNGVGMPAEVRESSFGIKLMKALAKKLKATLDFQPAPQQGTLATLHIKRYNLL